MQPRVQYSASVAIWKPRAIVQRPFVLHISKELDSSARFPGLEVSSGSLSPFEWNLYPTATGWASQGRNARFICELCAVWDQSFPLCLTVYADQGWQPPRFNLGCRSRTELSFWALLSKGKVTNHAESHPHASYLQPSNHFSCGGWRGPKSNWSASVKWWQQEAFAISVARFDRIPALCLLPSFQ